MAREFWQAPTDLTQSKVDIAKEIQALTVSVAKEVLAEEQARGFPKDPRVIVDRRRYDAPVESVKPFGRIEFVTRADMGEVAEWIWRRLVEKSPVDSGRYSDSHIIMINGVQVTSNNWTGLGPTDVVQIVNAQPYARKIERGLSAQAPSGVYRSVFAAAYRRYGKIVFLSYRLVNLNLGVTIKGRKGKRILQLYPAIQIRPSPGTLQ